MSSSLALPPLVLSARAAAARHWRSRGPRPRIAQHGQPASPRLALPGLTISNSSSSSSSSSSIHNTRGGINVAAAAPRIAPPSGHAPHGRASRSAAGPSRCFCQSHGPAKSSSSAAPALLADAYDPSPYDARDAYFAAPSRYQQPSLGDADEDLPTSAPMQLATSSTSPPRRSPKADFFTSALSEPAFIDRDQDEGKGMGKAKGKGKAKEAERLPNWSDQLAPDIVNSYLDRARVLLRSGERSLPAIAKSFPSSSECSRSQLKELQCLVLRDCMDREVDAGIVRDLYRSAAGDREFICTSDHGMQPSLSLNLQRSTVWLCFRYFVVAGLLRDAVWITSDPRLKRSQARFLIEQLLFGLEEPEVRARVELDPTTAAIDSLVNPLPPSSSPPPLCTPEQRDTRLALQELSESMRGWIDAGVQFKKPALQRATMLLCQARSYSHLLRLVRSLQQRVQRDMDALRQDMRTAGGLVRLRAQDDSDPPIFLPESRVVRIISSLCSQEGDGPRTAYEIFRMLPPVKRSRPMYHSLMERFGEVSILPAGIASSPSYLAQAWDGEDVEEVSSGSPPPPLPYSHQQPARSEDRELWDDYCRATQLVDGDATATAAAEMAHMISSRMLSHALHDNLGLIREDLLYLHHAAGSSTTFLDLTEPSQLAVLSCAIRHGDMSTGFRLARLLLSHVSAVDSGGDGRTGAEIRRQREALDRRRTRIFNALLEGAVDVRDVSLRRSSVAVHRHAPDPPPSSGAAGASVAGQKYAKRRLKHKRLTRSQRLQRFLDRFRNLLDRFDLRPDWKTVGLVVRLLTRWDHVVDVDKLEDVTCIIHERLLFSARKSDQRTLGGAKKKADDRKGAAIVLRTLVKAFERRGDVASARVVLDLLQRCSRYHGASM
ncbi:uncharacterized protein PFL1_01932 [Pseudozyma flocculosa PF-1]|uniref:Uncharacterized protein n=1 Tax=Pseudozyma flocculosa TaxID=84751 RepID=A0A5C3F2E9_9BASI|nr:uncharacterized protein PFL1_01932 [Pseudozyma flocculosa PF-1]EPQ30406.1 hypothetical protein PFL1_01932 [Pseudozyma flocculosa PF-1]SPO37481.1 uncharacterized protein PSFLO_02956 [Pseudozyma flocculosa]